ncbi:MAG: hypothetical protein LKE53_10070 [Oscillospiraceae bacterium]|jgi:hypothetical protein|nr:hypothetical protein [Oscillospiraceae bacterium]MDD3261118.1 hypothetical protein [Oscillospiraceae bacterium]
MDYWKWGQEYLNEAAVLKKHLTPVRRQLKQCGLSIDQSRELALRESMLYQMYLELSATGHYLQRCGR